MAKKPTKKKAPKKPKEKKEVKDPRIEEIYEEWVEFDCPTRGRVRQLVKVKRYKSLLQDSIHVVQSDDKIDKLDQEDDGLGIYSEDEEVKE